MTSEELCERLFRFAEMVIDIANALPKTSAGFAVGKQFVKAGTSIGANYEESQGAFFEKRLSLQDCDLFKGVARNAFLASSDLQ